MNNQIILKLLKEAEESLSGEQIASKLDVSRTAVWKVIDVFRSQGYVIEGVQNRGYRLVSEPYLFSEEAIRSRLSDDWSDLYIRCFETVTSTNLFARVAVGEGRIPCLIVTNGQTGGRGRRGKSFYSPPHVGLYFSLAFSWDREEPPSLLTTMAAVAICRVLERELGVRADIKWVNDIFIDGKKVGGILTEAIAQRDLSDKKAIVIGVGLNLERPEQGYPAELREKVGALSDALDHTNMCIDGTAFAKDEKGNLTFNRNVLVAMMINELTCIMSELPGRDYLDEYRERCFIIDREVVLDDGRTIVPTGISDDGALTYCDADGKIREITSGEISLVSF